MNASRGVASTHEVHVHVRPAEHQVRGRLQASTVHVHDSGLVITEAYQYPHTAEARSISELTV